MNQSLAPPEGGWKQSTIYLVEIAWNVNNPIHRCLFYSGFLNGKSQPAGYSGLIAPYEISKDAKLSYFKVVREVVSEEEWHGPKEIRMINDGNS